MAMREFGAVLRGMADAQLENAFGIEWIDLDPESRRLVLQDFLEGGEDENLTAREYLRRIGRGGLAGYAAVMKVRAARGWNR